MPAGPRANEWFWDLIDGFTDDDGGLIDRMCVS